MDTNGCMYRGVLDAGVDDEGEAAEDVDKEDDGDAGDTLATTGVAGVANATGNAAIWSRRAKIAL